VELHFHWSWMRGRSVRANPSPKNQGFQDERSELLLFLFPLFLLFLPFLLLEVLFLLPLFLFPFLFLFREGQGLHGGGAFGFLIKFRGFEAA
jgi:hypothetical protein